MFDCQTGSHLHQCYYFKNNRQNVWNPLCIFYWQGCGTPHRRDLRFRCIIMHAFLLQQSCSSTVISEPPCRGALLWLESIADRGTGNVELLLNSNRFTDTFYTLQLCSLDPAEWASPSQRQFSHTEVSAGQAADEGWNGATVTSSGSVLPLWGENCDHLVCVFIFW